MIGYVDTPPMIEPHGGGFIVTFKSGEAETRFMLTLYSLSGLVGRGRLEVEAAQAKASLFEPTAFQQKAAKGR